MAVTSNVEISITSVKLSVRTLVSMLRSKEMICGWVKSGRKSEAWSGLYLGISTLSFELKSFTVAVVIDINVEVVDVANSERCLISLRSSGVSANITTCGAVVRLIEDDPPVRVYATTLGRSIPTIPLTIIPLPFAAKPLPLMLKVLPVSPLPLPIIVEAIWLKSGSASSVISSALKGMSTTSEKVSVRMPVFMFRVKLSNTGEVVSCVKLVDTMGEVLLQ